jgi:hypothetical protein
MFAHGVRRSDDHQQITGLLAAHNDGKPSLYAGQLSQAARRAAGGVAGECATATRAGDGMIAGDATARGTLGALIAWATAKCRLIGKVMRRS